MSGCVERAFLAQELESWDQVLTSSLPPLWPEEVAPHVLCPSGTRTVTALALGGLTEMTGLRSSSGVFGVTPRGPQTNVFDSFVL